MALPYWANRSGNGPDEVQGVLLLHQKYVDPVVVSPADVDMGHFFDSAD